MNRFPILLAGFLAVSLQTQAETLNEVINKTLAENPQALAGLNKAMAQKKTIKAAKAGYWPTLDVAAGVGKQKKDLPEGGSEDIDNKTFTRKEASVSLKQNLFSGLNTLNSVRNARQKTRSEQWRLRSTLEDLGLKVADVYLKVLERRDLISLAEENLKFHNNIYEQIKQRTTHGIARSSDLAQIEGGRARARANLISSRNNLQDAESEYLALTGTMPGPLEQPGSYNLLLPVSLDEALKQARSHHPELKAATFDIRSSQSQYKVLRSSYFPTLDFEVDQNWRDNADGQLGTTRDTVAMLRVRYNLFRGGGDRARLQESANRVEESRFLRDRTDRNVEERLRIAWAALELIGQQKEFLRLHEKSSRETVSAYRKQFNIGKRTLLDLLDGENELFQASRSLASATYQEAFARYRILAATGQLLDTLEVSLPEKMLFAQK